MVIFYLHDKNSIEKLPNDLVNRSSAVLLACLGYAVQMLTWDQCDTLHDNLQPEGELSDTYLCMIFNDEVHTYEQVSGTNFQCQFDDVVNVCID